MFCWGFSDSWLSEPIPSVYLVVGGVSLVVGLLVVVGCFSFVGCLVVFVVVRWGFLRLFAVWGCFVVVWFFLLFCCLWCLVLCFLCCGVVSVVFVIRFPA